MAFEEELTSIATIPNGFKPMENLANQIEKATDSKEMRDLAHQLYQSETYQIRMVAVFLFGKLAANDEDVLKFMKQDVSKDSNWRVQEILAMAFDQYCQTTGYKEALPTIKEWLTSQTANVRRAVSEGLRIWTSRPFFKQQPEIAIELLAYLRHDTSEYVRKSCGNALRDISKKHPELILTEMSTWGDTKEESQIKKLILKNKKLIME